MYRLLYYYPVITCLILSIVSLSACTNSAKADDCHKYWQALGKATSVSIDTHTTEIKTKESTVKKINAIADSQDQLGRAIGDLKFKEAKSQELQKRHVEASNVFSQTFRNQANHVASLPGNPAEVELKKVPPEMKQQQSNVFKKWTQSGDDWLEYCKAYAPS